jgi:hypothetical protein
MYHHTITPHTTISSHITYIPIVVLYRCRTRTDTTYIDTYMHISCGTRPSGIFYPYLQVLIRIYNIPSMFTYQHTFLSLVYRAIANFYLLFAVYFSAFRFFVPADSGYIWT